MAKAFVILDAVAAIRGSATISELSAQTGLPRSTVHRIVTTLVERQALLRTDSGVQLGIRLFELGGLVPAQTRLRKEATPYMSELFASTRQTIHLGVLEGTEVLCTAKIMGHLPVGVPSQMGVRTRAHTCALGKAMLAFAPKSVVDQVIAGGLGAVTPQTITSPARFLAELRVIAQSGVAFDREEGTVGVRCVSAPILDHQGESIAAISVTAPRASFDRSRSRPLYATRRTRCPACTGITGIAAAEEAPGSARRQVRQRLLLCGCWGGAARSPGRLAAADGVPC